MSNLYKNTNLSKITPPAEHILLLDKSCTFGKSALNIVGGYKNPPCESSPANVDFFLQAIFSLLNDRHFSPYLRQKSPFVCPAKQEGLEVLPALNGVRCFESQCSIISYLSLFLSIFAKRSCISQKCSSFSYNIQFLSSGTPKASSIFVMCCSFRY